MPPVRTTSESSGPSRHRLKSLVSPAAVYQSVAGHIVALVGHRSPLPPRRCQSESKRVRGSSDASFASTSTCSSSVSFSDAPLVDPWSHDALEHCRDLRAAQSVCLHCRSLFFVAFAAAGAFCSLDCRTCFEFVERQDTLYANATSSPRSTLSVSPAPEDLV